MTCKIEKIRVSPRKGFVMKQPYTVKRLRDGDEVFKTKAIVEHLKKGDLIPFYRPIETKHI